MLGLEVFGPVAGHCADLDCSEAVLERRVRHPVFASLVACIFWALPFAAALWTMPEPKKSWWPPRRRLWLAWMVSCVGFVVIRADTITAAHRKAEDVKAALAREAADAAAAPALAAARQEFVHCWSQLVRAAALQGQTVRPLTDADVEGVTLEQFRANTRECRRKLPAQ